MINLVWSPGHARRLEIVQGARIPTFRQSLPALEAEIERSRRYERPLSLLATAAGEMLARNGTRAHVELVASPFDANMVAFLLLGSLLSEATREVDVVTQEPEARVYCVLLPETTAAEGWQLARRMARMFEERARASLLAGVAEFPRHALSIEDLLAFARGSLGSITAQTAETGPAARIGSHG